MGKDQLHRNQTESSKQAMEGDREEGEDSMTEWRVGLHYGQIQPQGKECAFEFALEKWPEVPSGRVLRRHLHCPHLISCPCGQTVMETHGGTQSCTSQGWGS